MKGSKVIRCTLVVVLAASLRVGSALAGQGTTCSIVNSHPGTAPGNGIVTLLKDGKFSIKPSKKGGDAGTTFAWALKSVDCPPNNQDGKLGACNATNHTIDVLTDFGGVQTHVGILYDVVAGKSALKINGGSKASGAQIFGPLALGISGNAIAVGIIKARGPGGDPSDCATVPLEFDPSQQCNNGTVYGVCGLIGGIDPTPGMCNADAQCSATQVCNSGTCEGQDCTQDSDCRSFSGAGSTVACNESPMTGDPSCCLVGVDPDPGCDID